MKILEPVSFKNLELKNRLVWLPAVTCLADEEGYVTDELIERHVARAKGGFALIDVEACGVLDRKSPTSSGFTMTNISPVSKRWLTLFTRKAAK